VTAQIPGASPASVARFEIRSQTAVIASSDVPIAADGSVQWTVPADTISAFAEYDIRVGTVSQDGTNWSGWRALSVAGELADESDQAALENADSEPDNTLYIETWAPDALRDGDDSGPPSSMTEEQANALDRSDDPDHVKYAPRLWFEPNETHFPLSPETFINHSELRWSHHGTLAGSQVIPCPDHDVAAPVGSSALGQGDYGHSTKPGCPPIGHPGGTYYSSSSDAVRPFTDGGPGGDGGAAPNNAEGIFLDLKSPYQAGGSAQDQANGTLFNGKEPVFYEYVTSAGWTFLTYWFHYGDSFIPYNSATKDLSYHEGDWERIQVYIDPADVPVFVRYFHHFTSCGLAWDEAPKINGHPKVWVARSGHGNYPAKSPQFVGSEIYPDRVGEGSKVWYANQNLKSAVAANWWGYQGGWGKVGPYGSKTGPEGPSYGRRARKPNEYTLKAVKRCEQA
jgi:hypothetical protein